MLDRAAAADSRAPLDRRERLDRRVLSDAHVHVDRRRLRVDDVHARQHVRAVDRRLRQRARLCQRDAVVDTEHQRRVVEHMRGDRLSVAAQQVERLRQVQLALRVIGTQTRQRLAQRARLKRVDSGVDLADLQVRGARVAVALGLHDAQHRAGVVAHDASVAARVLDDARDHRRRRAAALVRRDQALDRLGAEQRHVAAQHDDRPLAAARRDRVDVLHRRSYGPARAVGHRLNRQFDALRQHMLERPRRRVDDDHAPAPAASAARTGHSTIGSPHRSCSTFGVRERIRVPWPAARIRTVGRHCRHANARSRDAMGPRAPAGGQGFEPRFSGPKPDVLPLDDPPRGRHDHMTWTPGAPGLIDAPNAGLERAFEPLPRWARAPVQQLVFGATDVRPATANVCSPHNIARKARIKTAQSGLVTMRSEGSANILALAPGSQHSKEAIRRPSGGCAARRPGRARRPRRRCREGPSRERLRDSLPGRQRRAHRAQRGARRRRHAVPDEPAPRRSRHAPAAPQPLARAHRLGPGLRHGSRALLRRPEPLRAVAAVAHHGLGLCRAPGRRAPAARRRTSASAPAPTPPPPGSCTRGCSRRRTAKSCSPPAYRDAGVGASPVRALGDRLALARRHLRRRVRHSPPPLGRAQAAGAQEARPVRRGTRPPSAPASDAGPPAEAMPSTRIDFSPRLSFSRPSLELTSCPDSSRTRSRR